MTLPRLLNSDFLVEEAAAEDGMRTKLVDMSLEKEASQT
jgi:hypothetical protein